MQTKQSATEAETRQVDAAVTTAKVEKSLFAQKVADYSVLTKFRLSFLVVFSAVVSYLTAVPFDTVNWMKLLLLGVGGFLLTGASTALNQVIEKDLDSLMDRTSSRPLPAGRMGATEASIVAGIMSVAGIAILATFNLLTAVLGAISLLSYVFVYTPMKRISPIAVFIGAVPGALPTLIGWVAATGEFGWAGLSLFAVQFVWQFPHFWAIAWVSYEDYLRGGFSLLPTKNRDKGSALQCLLYCLLLIAVGFFPYFVGVVGIVASLLTVPVALFFAWKAWQLYVTLEVKDARALMFASFLYLPLVQLLLLFGKL